MGSALTVSSHGSHHCGPHAHYPPRGAPQPCLVCTHARNKCDKCAQAATNQRGTPAGRERRAQSCVPRSCLPPSTWTHLTLDTGDQWGGGRVTRDQSEDSSAQWRHYKCPVLSLFSWVSSALSLNPTANNKLEPQQYLLPTANCWCQLNLCVIQNPNKFSRLKATCRVSTSFNRFVTLSNRLLSQTHSLSDAQVLHILFALISTRIIVIAFQMLDVFQWHLL